jgi:hypothetical protein
MYEKTINMARKNKDTHSERLAILNLALALPINLLKRKEMYEKTFDFKDDEDLEIKTLLKQLSSQNTVMS